MLPAPSAGTRVRPSLTIRFSLASDWLRKWLEFYEPIRERSKAKPKQAVVGQLLGTERDYVETDAKVCILL